MARRKKTTDKGEQAPQGAIGIELWWIAQALITLGLGMVVRLSDQATAKRPGALTPLADGWCRVLRVTQLKAGEWLQLRDAPPKYMAAHLIAVDQLERPLPPDAVALLMHAGCPVYRIVGTDDGRVIGVTDDGLISVQGEAVVDVDPDEVEGFADDDPAGEDDPPLGDGLQDGAAVAGAGA